jgi:hypothetical protein
MIPDGQDGKVLKDAINSTASNRLSSKQEETLRKYQSENSIMASKIPVLTRKIEELQVEYKKYAWVESVLVRLNEGVMYRLKTKFQKKEGVSSI